MDVVEYVDSISDAEHQIETESYEEETKSRTHCRESNQDKILCDSTEKHSAVWTSGATSTLLKLYDLKLELLETPKRKKRIWRAISENLKDYNFDMSPDQVRWKINALTKKYKRSVDTGAHQKFKYFKEMDQIYLKYGIDNYRCTISDLLDSKNDVQRHMANTNVIGKPESKAIIELRKIRLANRIESDRAQTKIHMERQWLEYLKRQEHIKEQRDKMICKSLKFYEQGLELRKKYLEVKQSLELRNIQLKEKNMSEILQVEKDKCELLKQLLS